MLCCASTCLLPCLSTLILSKGNGRQVAHKKITGHKKTVTGKERASSEQIIPQFYSFIHQFMHIQYDFVFKRLSISQYPYYAIFMVFTIGDVETET